jgi:predicted transcriptional regulator of viral defense system
MEKILNFFYDHGGYARMRDLKAAAIQTRDITRLVRQNKIEKIKPGLYRLVDLPEVDGIPISFFDICHAIPKGIICLVSALEYYDLTTFNPSEIYVAIPHAEKKPKIEYPPAKIYFFRNRFYQAGIQEIRKNLGVIRIYNPEKTICDMFRYRNKLGEDIALEGLKNYLGRKDANINKLQEYAEMSQVKTVLFPYIKVLIAG